MSIKEKFLAAVDVVQSIPHDGTFEPSDEIMQKFYAYYKQATEGPCSEAKPFIWNAVARNKWVAWKELEEMPPEVAMEKYIEELAKVIETMAYNEKIAKFMSLIGPFYEVVSTEEADTIRNQNTESEKWSDGTIPSAIFQNMEAPTLSDLYRINRKETSESLKKMEQASQNIPSTAKTTEILENLKHGYCESSSKFYSQSSISSSSSTSSEASNFDLLSDLSSHDSGEIIEVDNLPLSNNPPSGNFPRLLTKEDIFILTFLNLHSSMQDILEKLDTLNKIAQKNYLEDSEKYSSVNNWNLKLTGAAFIFIWPIVLGTVFG